MSSGVQRKEKGGGKMRVATSSSNPASRDRTGKRDTRTKKLPRSDAHNSRKRARQDDDSSSAVPVSSEGTHPTTNQSGLDGGVDSNLVELTPEEYLRKIEMRVASASATSSTGVRIDTLKLAQDPIYRILHQTHRSDVIEVVKCKFGEKEAQTASEYVERDFMLAPVRRCRLQIMMPMVAGIGRFIPFLSHHSATLRLLDLSRNKLNADDVATLCDALHLVVAPTTASSGGASQPQVGKPSSALEVLDLSYNRAIGNRGATSLLQRISNCSSLQAVILKSISIDDEGAAMMAPYLKIRVVPAPPANVAFGASMGSGDEEREMAMGQGIDLNRWRCNFFVNLNENCIGANGVKALRVGLPDHVSLTVIKQRILARPSKGNVD